MITEAELMTNIQMIHDLVGPQSAPNKIIVSRETAKTLRLWVKIGQGFSVRIGRHRVKFAKPRDRWKVSPA